MWAIFILNIALIGGGGLYNAIAAFLQLVCILFLWFNLKKLKQ